MAFISFLYPKFLLFLLLIPLFTFIYFFSIVYKKKKSMIFGNFEAMRRIYDIEFFSKNFLGLYLNIAILCLFVFALAGTQVNFQAETGSFSYIIAIDTSLSMKTSDVSPNRLEASKDAAKQFIDFLPVGVETSVIGFSGDARIVQGLTTSKIKSKMAVDSITFGRVQGSNIYNALLTSQKIFSNARGGRGMKSVVIISDGQLNVASAAQVIRYANQKNIVVNTIAVGTEEGGRTELDTISRADIDFLSSLAFETGGSSFMAGNIEELEESITDIVMREDKEVSVDLSVYLLLAGIILFTLYWIFYNLRFRIFP